MRRPRKNRRKRSWLRAVRNLLVVALFGELAAALLTTPLLAVRQVQVTGARSISANDILSVAGVQAGTNLLRVPTALIRKRISILPAVRTVRVHRRPPHMIVLDVTERRPHALVRTGDTAVVIDEESVPFHTASAATKGMCQLVIPRVGRVHLGRPLKSKQLDVALECMNTVVQALPGVTSIAVDAQLNLCLNIGAFKVKLGQPEQVPRKVALAASLVKGTPSLLDTGEYLDVSSPDCPAWKPRELASSPNQNQQRGGAAGSSVMAQAGGSLQWSPHAEMNGGTKPLLR